MRGITGWGTHLPYARLDRSAIKAVAGTGGGAGTVVLRTTAALASYRPWRPVAAQVAAGGPG